MRVRPQHINRSKLDDKIWHVKFELVPTVDQLMVAQQERREYRERTKPVFPFRIRKDRLSPHERRRVSTCTSMKTLTFSEEEIVQTSTRTKQKKEFCFQEEEKQNCILVILNTVKLTNAWFDFYRASIRFSLLLSSSCSK